MVFGPTWGVKSKCFDGYLGPGAGRC
jgi:hypothetical protein